MPRPSIQLSGGKPRRRPSVVPPWIWFLLLAGLIGGGWGVSQYWNRSRSTDRTPSPAPVPAPVAQVVTNAVTAPRPVVPPTVVPPSASNRVVAPVERRVVEPPPVRPALTNRPVATSRNTNVIAAPIPSPVLTNAPVVSSNRPALRVESGLVRTNAPREVVVAGTNELDSARWSLPATNRIALQIALAARGISSGSIDGLPGAQTESAIRAFQLQQGLESTGRPDSETLRRLQPGGRCLTARRITEADLARIRPIPTTWLGKSQSPRLDYESVLELVAEEAQSHPRLIRQLNPTVNFDALQPGVELVVPKIETPPVRQASVVRINLSQRWLRAFDDRGFLLLHFPCSIGRIAEKRPVGELQVLVTAKDPNYTFDPAVFPESAEARGIRTKLILPPGPNNPVGVAWIGLNRPGFGIHGTPGPEQVGRTESHGCFRLANWNAELLRRRVKPGTTVVVEP